MPPGLYDDDPEYRQGRYSGSKAYARTKRMQQVLANLWAQRLATSGVVSHAMHPGWVDTPGVRTFLPKLRAASALLIRTPEQGADTIVWLVASPTAARSTGEFWSDRQQRSTTYAGRPRETAEQRQRFWDYCEQVTAVAAVGG